MVWFAIKKRRNALFGFPPQIWGLTVINQNALVVQNSGLTVVIVF